MLSAEPLNRDLYGALESVFGDVRISCEGEAFVGDWIWDSVQDRWQLDVQYPGEQYLVNCPKCGDTRHRLQIHHLWGVADVPPLPRSVLDGRKDRKRYSDLKISPFKKNLVICFNEDCYSNYKRRLDLYDYVCELSSIKNKRMRIFPGKKIDPKRLEVDLPGPVIRVHKLPFRHPAVEYLEGRHFDVERLGRKYGIAYCKSSNYFLACDRIIIPIHYGGKLRSWQARYIGDPPRGGPPKYFTAPNSHIGQVLYNLDRAKQWKTGVVTEGVTDVWSYGLMAMAYFKQKMGKAQIDLLIKNFKRQSLVLLPDSNPEAFEMADWVYEQLQSHIGKGVAVVKLNAGDPGSLDRRFLREYTIKEAKAQGVKVQFEKR